MSRPHSGTLLVLLVALSGPAACRQLAGYEAARVGDGGLGEQAPADGASLDGASHGRADGSEGDLATPPARPSYQTIGPERLTLRMPLFRDGDSDKGSYHDVYATWHSEEAGTWAVGRAGWIVHSDGGGFRRVQILGDVEDLRAVWGAGPRDVWIAGTIATTDGQRAYHFDGEGPLKPLELDTFEEDIHAIAGSGDGAVWFAGDTGALRYDGVGFWNASSSGSPRDLWSPSPGEVWAPIVGGLEIFREGQSKAQSITLQTGAPLRTIWGSSKSKLYLGGSEGQLWTSDGSTLTTVHETSAKVGETAPVEAIWGDREGIVWAVVRDHVYRYEAGGWTVHYEDADPPDPPDRRVFHDIGPAGDGIYVASSGGNLFRLERATNQWLRVGLSNHLFCRALLSSGKPVGAGGTLWIVSNKGVFRERGWGPEVLLHDGKVADWITAGYLFRGGAIDSAGKVWLVGDEGMVASVAGDEVRQVERLTDQPELRAAWADSTQLWIAAADGRVHRVPLSGGTAPPPLVVQNGLQAIWGDGKGAVYVAGDAGLHRLDATQGGFVRVTLSKNSGLSSVHGAGQRIWAVGEGLVERSRDGGQTWQSINLPTRYESAELRAVYVPPTGPVWIAGNGGLLLRSDPNGALMVVDTNTSALLRAVGGSSSSDVWIGGEDRLYHLPD